MAMNFKRFLLAFATLLLATASLAASVAERSPFAQGLWWERARSGSGFEMFNAGGQAMVIWYTFDEGGRPTWYTAQGDPQAIGQSWPLLKHRWMHGVKAAPTVVGSLAVSFANAESGQVAWQVGTRSGVATVEPFLLSGVRNEVDHSGTWFDPANEGWGLTLLEQGDITGAALFTYTVDGEPTWAAGFERGKGSVELFVSSGACPWCAYRTPNTASAGRIAFDFGSEAGLSLINRTALPMAPGLTIDAARMTQLSRPASTRAADNQLASFDAASLRNYLAGGMLNFPSPYTGDFSAGVPPPTTASPGAAFSPTNVQVDGVDEASLVKTNGTHVYTYAYAADQYTRLPEVRIARVADEGASVKAVGSVSIGSGYATPMGTAGLYLYDKNLVSVHGSRSYGYGWYSGPGWSGGLTQVEILDVSSPELPVSKWRADIDGYIVASRRVGPMLYVVSRFTPYLPGFVFYAYTPAQRSANDQILAAAALDTLIPKARTTDGDLRALLKASDVFAPPQGARKSVADLILVTAIDIDARRIKQSLAIAGYVDAVYVSPSSLYVASSRYDASTASGGLLPEPPLYRTDLHQIRLGTDAMSMVGSGSIEGYLNASADKAPLRMDEYRGRMRVVTTSINNWWGNNSNRVTVLEPSTVTPGLLKTVAWLPNAQRPEPLGKPRESLHATRFSGDRLYAVTFKQIDPLYVVDLSQPADPMIAGALQIPGFSEYLHPLPNGLLLGFGKDAVPALDFGDGSFAWYQGLQLSLYDVRDAGKPVEKQRIVIGKRGSVSALLQNHQAFSALPLAADQLSIGIPASIHDGFPQYGTGPSTFYPWSYSGLLRFELRGATAEDARLVQMPALVSHNPQVSPPSYDPGAYDGRSVLFARGAVFVGSGRFWHQDERGTTTGPF